MLIFSPRRVGTSAEAFIRKYDSIKREEYKSKYEKFREIIARLVKTDVKNVDIFTVLSRQERPAITDIRYSAHGSPYYKPSSLDGIVALHREQVSSLPNVLVVRSSLILFNDTIDDILVLSVLVGRNLNRIPFALRAD